jgi:hypothetical protein
MSRSLWLLSLAALLSGATCIPQVSTEVTVSVAGDGFTATEMEVVAIYDLSYPPLSQTKPAGILVEPSYSGERQLYGWYNLGTTSNKQYYFIVDLVSPSQLGVYFDRNHNGDLSDDGGPIANQGTSLFAAAVIIPHQQLAPESPFSSDFLIWIYASPVQGSMTNGFMDHYSRTQYKGSVSLNGQTYTAYLADRGPNDADLTNDGIYIDLNRDGAIDDATEWFPADHDVSLPVGTFRFHIGW